MEEDSFAKLTPSIFRKQVLAETNRDVLSLIGLAGDKIRQIDLNRRIDLDPAFWALDDFIVSLIWNGKTEDIEKRVEILEKERDKLLAQLKDSAKHTKFFNESRASFELNLDSFVNSVSSARKDPSPNLEKIALSVVSAVRELESAKIENLELQLKVQSLSDKIENLQDRIQTKNSAEDVDVEAWLGVTGIQSSMLNELLTTILDDVKDIARKRSELSSQDPRILTEILRETYYSNFWALNHCFPAFGFERECKHTALTSNAKHMSLEEYLSVLQPSEIQQKRYINMRQWKKRLRESHDTHEKIILAKKKLDKLERTKAANFEVVIPRSEVKGLLPNRRSFVRF